MAHTEFLHAANALVGFVAVATAETLTGGGASALTALLSGSELLKSYRAPPSLQTQIAKDIAERCDNAHLTDHQRKLFAQMVQAAPLSANEITAAARDPVAISQAMLARLTYPAHQTPQAQQRFCDIIQPLLAYWLADTAFCDTLRPAFEADLAQRVQAIESMVAELLAATREDARRYHINEGTLIGVARRYAPDAINDFDGAMRGIENALKRFEEERAKNAQRHNSGDQIDAALAEVQTLNEAGKIDLARAELVSAEAAAQDRIKEETAGLTRIYDRMIAQAALQNSPQDAVDALLKRLALDTPADPFEALRAVQDEWDKRYQTHGVPFDGQIALLLARAVLARVGDDQQRSTAQNDVGNILQVIGHRAGDSGLLGQAVDAYRAALRVRSEKDTPLGWAMTQNNLGAVLRIMGQRAADDALLGQSVDAYRAALRVYSEKDTPQEWANTQNNLGIVLAVLGQIAGDTDLLVQAVDAYRATLRVYTEKETPQEWATMQTNLGGALAIMGRRGGDDGLMGMAVDTYRAALRVRSETHTPQHWAATQNNLGIVLKLMGQRAGDVALLRQAENAYRAVLRVYSETDTPMDWAETMENLGLLYLTFFDLTADPAHLTAAQSHALAARAVYERLGAAAYLQNTDLLLAEIASRDT
jgi:tetratricopeptide (TPR) repeat protein